MYEIHDNNKLRLIKTKRYDTPYVEFNLIFTRLNRKQRIQGQFQHRKDKLYCLNINHDNQK